MSDITPPPNGDGKLVDIPLTGTPPAATPFKLPTAIHYTDPNVAPDKWLDDAERKKAMDFLMRNDAMFNNLRQMLSRHEELSEYAQLEIIVLAMARDREEMVNAGMHAINKWGMTPTPAPDTGKRIIMPGEAQ